MAASRAVRDSAYHDDYLSIARDVCPIPEHLEGLAAVHCGELYYLFGSHLTSWRPNPNVYSTAKSLAVKCGILGQEWEALLDIGAHHGLIYK